MTSFIICTRHKMLLS